ncbi:DMT family transporter [Ahrensia sp. 13_GOM-1096m]|uniref:aromatic amino acid exporter YddG n=1 Tax=Ahrensia sp. 13_GOM-1096m TaxID=1380380 RepID=UPI0004793278|nr:DMT family transporter [Ahrensia sp. 13_GOM-1096m]
MDKDSSETHTNSATIIGFTAVLMWALLALFTDATGNIPPFQLAFMTFFIGTLIGIIWNIGRKKPTNENPIPLRVALAGGIALFAYHALYFGALKNAPAVEASLIAYLWPLLIVVCSALLPGEKLGWHHVLGAFAGFAGTILIVTGGKGFTIDPAAAFGYGLAFAAAFTWTAYSLASRKFADVPTKSVIAYCAVTTVLALAAHLMFEETTLPSSTLQWLAIIGLGLLPVGAAFYTWDYGMKRGDVQVIGASSYAAPLLSTIILIAFGRAIFSWSIVFACLLITFGAMLAAKNIIRRRKPDQL